MGIIVANLFLTLDGVYQAPGGPDEDPEGGFPFGGWQAPLFDDETGADVDEGVARLDALLLGRKTYDIFGAYWPNAGDDPTAVKFNSVPKYVVSRTLTDASWAGTTVLKDAAAVGLLRDHHDEIHMWGSGELVRSLVAEGSIDRLNLWLYPLTLGTGKRLFATETVPASFRLVRPPRAFPKGGISLVYERAGGVATGDMSTVRDETLSD